MRERAAALSGILLYYFCIFPLQVIAIVTDSLTDLDIFKDLQEACAVRNVPVYILLDQSSSPAFLEMCRNIGICLDDLQVCGWFSAAGCGRVCTITWSGSELKYVLVRLDGTVAGWGCLRSRLPPHLLFSLQQMRVRTITGTDFYMRSGVRITGRVHERFMLIDGIKVATGSYR